MAPREKRWNPASGDFKISKKDASNAGAIVHNIGETALDATLDVVTLGKKDTAYNVAEDLTGIDKDQWVDAYIAGAIILGSAGAYVSATTGAIVPPPAGVTAADIASATPAASAGIEGTGIGASTASSLWDGFSSKQKLELAGLGITTALGFSDAFGGGGDSAASGGSGTSVSLAEDQLAWTKEQFALHEEAFGPIQDNLSEYYRQLDPDSYATRNIQGIQKEYQTAQEEINKELAQRGLDTSGIQAQSISEGLQALAGAKAEARVEAPRQVAQEQQSFLNLGIQQQATDRAAINSAFGNLQSAQTAQNTLDYNRDQADTAAYTDLATTAVSAIPNILYPTEEKK